MERRKKQILIGMIVLFLLSLAYYHFTFTPSTKYLSKQQKMYVERVSPDQANEMIESESHSAYVENMISIIFFFGIVILGYWYFNFVIRITGKLLKILKLILNGTNR